jgi:hypothetical protein
MALPDTRFNFQGGKKEVAEIVSGIGQAIFSQVRGSLEAASKTVVPSIETMVAEITEDLSSGPIDRFNQGLEKVDKLVNKMGVDLGKYSKDLNKFLQERTKRAQQSEETINQLRTQNIIAQVNKFGEVSILTKSEIEDQKKLLREQNVEIKDSQKIIEKYSKVQQRGGDLTEEQSAELVEANKKVIETTDKRNETLKTLNIQETDDTRTFREKFGDAIDEYVPDGLRDIGSAFTEGLMAPFTAVKELGLLFGSILKPLKAIPKLLKGFIAGLFGAIIAFIPFLLKAALVVGAIVLLKETFDFLKEKVDENKEALIAFKDKILEIPGKIKDFFDEKFELMGVAFDNFVEDVKAIPGKISAFFRTIFTKIQNFFIDAINAAIGMINEYVPFVELDKLPNIEVPAEASPIVGPVDSPAVAEAKSAFKTEGSGPAFLKANTGSTATNNSVIDGSVKTNVSNNTTIGSFVSSKNNDNARFNLYADVSP